MGKVYIISGAGLSAESGVPTFRDANGLWHNHRIEDVCDIRTWRENFDLVHEFYNQRRVDLEHVYPNAMHLQIAEWQREFGKENIVNITTNVDDLLERAGVDDVVHLHGDITKIVNVCNGDVSDIGYSEYQYKNDKNRIIKPYVVFFGEHAPEYETLRAITHFDMQNDDMVIFVGMSFQVVPVGMCVPYNKLPIMININPDVKTAYDWDWNMHIQMPCCQAVDQIDGIVKAHFRKAE